MELPEIAKEDEKIALISFCSLFLYILIVVLQYLTNQFTSSFFFHSFLFFLTLIFLVSSLLLLLKYSNKVEGHERILFMFLLGLFLVLAIAMYAHLYKKDLIDVRVPTRPLSFLDCFYFSAITWTSLGYGDIVLNSGSATFQYSQFIVISEVLVGYVTLAFIVKIISNYTQSGTGKER